MRLHKLVVVMAALAGSIAPLSASALGMGEVKLYSSLNQPLMAEIELTQVRELTRNEILSNLASKVDFQRAGIERPFMLSGLKFRTEVGPNGNGIIKVTSTKPIHEPFLNFLVEVHWPSGRLLKEYTLLLDPPAFNGQLMAPVDQAVSDATPYGVTPVTDTPVLPQSSSVNTSASQSTGGDDNSSRSTQSSTVTTGRLDRPKTNFSSPSSSGNQSDGPDTYRVNRNDSLWEIARDVRPGSDLSIQQTMVAIQRANPQAFIDDNINRLKTGQVLRIPSRNQITSIAMGEAISDVSRQNSEWAGRSQVAQIDATRVTSPVAEDKRTTNSDGTLAIVTPDGSTGRGQDLGGGSVENEAGLQTELAMTREQMDKVSRENAELKSRLGSLDEQIETLERLLVVKEDQLAALQNQGDLQPEESLQPDESLQPQEADLGVVVNEPPPAPKPEPMPEPLPEPVAPDDFQMEKTGFVSFLLGNPILLAALGVLPFGAAILLFLRNRKKKQEEADEDDDFQALDLVPASGNLQSTVSGDDQLKFDEALNIDDSVVDDIDSGVTTQQTQDVISEADIYIAYGHLDQAEELVQQAIANEPGRADLKAKLAEIYAEAGDQVKFDQAVSAVQATGDATAVQAAEGFRSHFPNSAELNASPAAPQQDELPEFDLSEFDSDVTTDDASDSGDLEFDLDGFGSEPEPAPAATPAAAEDDFNLDDIDFGFDVEDDNSVGQDIEAAFSDDGGSSFEESLDDDLDFMDDGDEASTKLDLARAYMDMGDMEGAASILQEVVEQGSDEQKQEANDLLQAAGVS
ncbi:FimV/HubP family polar landmark protein [Endozoicomonas ascidiicola]|uniref:FimV/HubP family polar landmark protein n=1 Tax=Endozoicomonas ascidiicola TaxID=1698521 RepID=UPI000832595A|nr:FimV/HubP family polar landmark protein [Endozoicomonas ascidiicola]